MSTSLSPEIYNTPLAQLHLPKRVYEAVARTGITTVGPVVALDENELLKIPNLGVASATILTEIVNSFLSAVNGNDVVNWVKFWHTQGIELIPELEAVQDGSSVLMAMPELIRTILSTEADERLWPILQRRYGLQGMENFTLNELSIVFGISRERVRHLEAKAKQILSQILFEGMYVGRQFHVRPEVESVLQQIIAIIRDTELGFILESRMIDAITSKFGLAGESINDTMVLILAVSEHERIDLDSPDLGYLWKHKDTQVSTDIELWIHRLNRLLTEDTAKALGEIDILLMLNRDVKKPHRLDLGQLRAIIPLCNTIEEHTPGHYWGKFHFLQGRGNQVERILLERAEPMLFRDILRELNHRMTVKDMRSVAVQSLTNQISADVRFVPIGRSGAWALASWSVETGTILELMVQYLTHINRPALPREIYTYVAERRPVNEGSIQSYLVLDDRFYRTNRTHWGLSSWSQSSTEREWTPLQIGELVEKLFKASRKKQLPYADVRDAISAEAQVSKKQAIGLLTVNPVIQTERQNGRIIALLQPDWREILKAKGATFARQKKTLRQLTEEYVQERLRSAPGNQLTLSEIVKELTNKYDSSARTFYQYVSALDFIEKYSIPETRTVMCKLKSDGATTPYLAADEIHSDTLRANVERALTFMNESDIDIALFLLSKEFESSLSAYVDGAVAKGAFKKAPTNHNLNGLINFVHTEKIISDQSILNFLRQERNARAHGSAPSIEERRILMRHAEVMAGMYIDYIKFFDELLNQLP